VFRVEDDQMVERIDKWDLLTRYKASHVYPEIYMTDLPLSEELNERLYFENMKKLNLKISNRHLKALHLKSESLSNIKIAKTWSPDNHDFSPRTVEKYFTEVSNILREHFRDYPIGAHGIEKLAKTYGLLPIPESLLKKDSM
jgi:hypothetical protein